MDLKSKYLNLELRSPIVVSASTLAQDVDNIVRMEDCGAGAVVLFSLFEEQIRKEEAFLASVRQATTNVFAEGLDYFPAADEYHTGVDEYLELIRSARERVDIPIVASLNGITPEGWIEYAGLLEQAGASALEINIFYIPADIGLEGSAVEQRYIDIVSMVKKTVGIPIAVKLNPYFSAMGNMAQKLTDAGADGLVLFNRFYQPDINISNLRIQHNLQFSAPAEIRLPLLWISVLYGKLPVSLAGTTGVHGAEEVIKYLLAGADVAMTASALYLHGIEHLKEMHRGLRQWMEAMRFERVADMRGILSQLNVQDPSAFERANYIRILEGMK